MGKDINNLTFILVASQNFQSIKLPIGISPTNVKKIEASYVSLVLFYYPTSEMFMY